MSDYITIVKKKDPNSATQQTTLIDIITFSEKLNLPYFSHFAFEIRLRGTRASVPDIYQKLSTYVKVGRRSEFMPIFNRNLSKGGSAQEFKFVFGPHKESNVAVEMVLKLLPNAIRYEWAGYYSNQPLVTNFRREFDPIILLLFFCETLYTPKLMDIEVDIEINTNGELNFSPQASYFKASGGMVSYLLNPKNLERSLVLRETAENNLVEIMKVIIQGFSAEPGLFGNADPFLTFDEDTQLNGLTALGDSVFS